MHTKSIHRQIASFRGKHTSHIGSDWVWGMEYDFFPFKRVRLCYTDPVLPGGVTKNFRSLYMVISEDNLAKSQRQIDVEVLSFSGEHFFSPFFMNFSLSLLCLLTH